MYDKISVTPCEYVSFIEFYDQGHSANKHGSKMVLAVVVVSLKPGSIHSKCHDHDTKTKRLSGWAVILHANHFVSNRNWSLSWL